MKFTFDSAVVAKRVSNATSVAKTKTTNAVTAFRAPVNPEAVRSPKIVVLDTKVVGQ